LREKEPSRIEENVLTVYMFPTSRIKHGVRQGVYNRAVIGRRASGVTKEELVRELRKLLVQMLNHEIDECLWASGLADDPHKPPK